MSLISSMYSGTSGLEAASDDLSVVGNNIANANTIGFDYGRADFAETFAQSLIGGSGAIGEGTELADVQTIVSQGTITQTGVPTDLALNGNGYFLVQGSNDGVPGTYYTRDGEFQVNSSGYLVNGQGMNVEGYTEANGVMGSTLGGLQVGNATSAPQATANVTIQANLDSTAAVNGTFDPTNPSGTSDYSTSTTVYTASGTPVQATVYFSNEGNGQWTWNAVADGGSVAGGTAGTATVIASGTLTFNSSGDLTALTQTSNFTPAGSTTAQALNFNFGTPASPGITQFAEPSGTTLVSQDGYAAGTLSNVTINTQGQVEGVFSNGQTQTLGAVAVATFQAPDQLADAGNNLLQATAASGQANVGDASSGGRASITQGALEQSNVDISAQLVEMISAQRNFEANSKTISTADQLLSDLMSMKH